MPRVNTDLPADEAERWRKRMLPPKDTNFRPYVGRDQRRRRRDARRGGR